MKQWHKGPPPSIGWWPASAARCSDVFRWWNGECWSSAAEKNSSAWGVYRAANTRAFFRQTEIEWTDRPEWWPERSKT